MATHTPSFEDWLNRQDYSRNTVYNYSRHVARFADWYRNNAARRHSVEDSDPAGLADEEDVREYRDWHIRRHRSPSSIIAYLSALRAYFTWAREVALRDDDPCEHVGLPGQQPPGAPKALSKEDEEAILEAARHQRKRWSVKPPYGERFTASRDLAMLVLMSKAGLRRAEVVGLQAGDIIRGDDDELSALRVWGKGSKQREVPLGSAVRQVLATYLREIEAESLKGTDPLFPSYITGDALTPQTANLVVKKYARIAGVHCSAHALRHTFGTRMLREMGADLVLVSELLGHSSLETTRHYTLPTKEQRAAAVERL